jgi:secreted trypsin-like serine protease
MLKTIFIIFLVIFSSSCDQQIDSSIIRGSYARDGDFPYMVSLRPVSDQPMHGCGGGILNSRWILTAGK